MLTLAGCQFLRPIKILLPERGVNPLPSGPTTAIVSPSCLPENSNVPAPATRYTKRIMRLAASISHILIGLGSSLLPSSLYSDKNCPGFATLQHCILREKQATNCIFPVPTLTGFFIGCQTFLFLCHCYPLSLNVLLDRSVNICDHVNYCLSGGICIIVSAKLTIFVLLVCGNDTTRRVDDRT